MLGALVSAGASLLGSYLSQRNANRNVDLQREFATTGIQRKVADARAAGVSPLFALGANTNSFSPVSIGGDGGLSQAGQNISRAVAAQGSPQGRAGALAVELAQAQLDGVKLDNQAKQQEIQSKMNLINQPGTPPAIVDSGVTQVMPGQPEGVELKKEMAPAGWQQHKSFGVAPEVDMWRTAKGYAPEVPQELGEAHESQPLAAAQWFLRNKIMPTFSEGYRTHPFPAPEGFDWHFNPVLGQYVLQKESRFAELKRAHMNISNRSMQERRR